jgi:hypothetical protein
MNRMSSNLACICLLGLLAACGVASPDPDSTAGDSHTIRLNRLENGNYEYCDENGECRELPSNGSDCAVLEIRVDLATGQSCQTCILADGTAVDQGCSGSYVVCTLVTIPEPDCVVCAYVNGAIVYSSCTVDDGPQPECTSDRDCQDANGNSGYCRDGYCYYGPGGSCTTDADCRYAEYCRIDVCPAAPCVQEDNDGDGQFDDDDWSCPQCFGQCAPYEPVGCEAILCAPGYVCVEQEVQCFAEPCYPVAECVPVRDCRSDEDCNGGVCVYTACTEMYCEDGTNDCNTCWGYCDTPWVDPCAGIACEPGTHCEAREIWCVTTPCDPVGECVPDYYDCTQDSDCGEGGVCMIYACGACPPESSDGNTACDPRCVGYCDYPSPCDTVRCGEGFICKEVEVQCFAAPCDPVAECVPVGPFNCDGPVLCDMVSPECPEGQVPAIQNGCYGPCVPRDQCRAPSCQSDADCGPGGSCVTYCVDCFRDDPSCVGGCFSECVNTEPPEPSDCVVSGCSGEICADEYMNSTCIWREEYACYREATCERSADGVCGWRRTEELAACIERARN